MTKGILSRRLVGVRWELQWSVTSKMTRMQWLKSSSRAIKIRLFASSLLQETVGMGINASTCILKVSIPGTLRLVPKSKPILGSTMRTVKCVWSRYLPLENSLGCWMAATTLSASSVSESGVLLMTNGQASTISGLALSAVGTRIWLSQATTWWTRVQTRMHWWRSIISHFKRSHASISTRVKVSVHFWIVANTSTGRKMGNCTNTHGSK